MLECIAIITKNQGSLSTVVGDEKLTSREGRISPKDRLKIVIDLASIFIYQVKELIYSLLLNRSRTLSRIY